MTEDRGLKVRVKTARGRKLSSTLWLERQLNDPYVHEAKRLGLRSRSAFKLKEINERYHLIKPNQCVLDLGAAPGGWSQVAAEAVRAGEGPGRVIAVDLQDVAPMADVEILKLDFMDFGATEKLKQQLGDRSVDVVLSDMAAPATGHKSTDHLKIMALLEAAYEFALDILTPGGTFMGKVLQGGTETSILAEMKRSFANVQHVKPKASRQDSSELYVLGTCLRKSD
jgi:23S rRNA (uridine2552-2'-O)-methyltransferase